MKHAILMTVCMIVLMFASSADAHASGYTISQKAAQHYAMAAAETRYESNGVEALDSYCEPQFVRKSDRKRTNWTRYNWHRWVCVWVGFDGDVEDVYGGMRITGHSNGTYGYMPLFGGLQWGVPS